MLFRLIDVDNSDKIEWGEFRMCGLEVDYDSTLDRLRNQYKKMNSDEYTKTNDKFKLNDIIDALCGGTERFRS